MTDINSDWSALRERLLAFIRSRVSHPADAEDLLHDIFARMQRSLDDLDDAERFDAWLYRIARNVIIDYYRASARRQDAVDSYRNDPSAAEAVGLVEEDDGHVRRQLAACVAPLIEQLPANYSQALQMTDLGEFTQQEAAERLDLSVSGMKSRVQRGRAHLKGLLLECCNLELDHRGEVVDIDPDPSCCGDDTEEM